MVLSKRERVIRALSCEEPDIVPIHYLGFERTGTAYYDVNYSLKIWEEY